MVAAGTARLVALAASLARASATVETPGWAFDVHGGFPPLPWGQSGRVQDATAIYFAGNASGFDSAYEAAAAARFGVVGIGWQVNNVPSNFSHEEGAEARTSRQLKAARPGVRTLVSRETEVITVFWDAARAAIADHPECASRRPAREALGG